MAIANAAKIFTITGTETWENLVAYDIANSVGAITVGANRSFSLTDNTHIYAAGSGASLVSADINLTWHPNSSIQAVGGLGAGVYFTRCQFVFPTKDAVNFNPTPRNGYIDWIWSDTTLSASRQEWMTDCYVELKECHIYWGRSGSNSLGNLTISLTRIEDVTINDYADPQSFRYQINHQIWFRGSVISGFIAEQIFRLSLLNSSGFDAQGLKFNECRDSYRTETSGVFPIFNAVIRNPNAVIGSLANDSTLLYLNPVDVPSITTSSPNTFYHDNGNAAGGYGYTIRLDFDLAGVKVAYRDQVLNTYLTTTDGGGFASLNLVTQLDSRTTPGFVQGFTELVSNFNPWEFAYRKYGYLPQSQAGASVTIDSPTGRPGANARASLLVDSIVQASEGTYRLKIEATPA